MKKENLKRLRKYAMKEAWRIYKFHKKMNSGKLLGECFKNSYRVGKKLLQQNEDFIFYTDK